MYVEQAFFQRWWRQQSEATRDLTRRLVASRQLEFVNGGWCMHDEASTYYVDMIDQTTLGHKFITLEFGSEALPTIGWQIGQRPSRRAQRARCPAAKALLTHSCRVVAVQTLSVTARLRPLCWWARSASTACSSPASTIRTTTFAAAAGRWR